MAPDELCLVEVSSRRAEIRTYAHLFIEREAWRQVEAWLDQPPAWVPSRAAPRRPPSPGGSPRHAPDAHLAALAVEHGLVLRSTDRDFARFDVLRWEGPLEA